MTHDPGTGERFGDPGDEGWAVCADEPGRCCLNLKNYNVSLIGADEMTEYVFHVNHLLVAD